MIKKIVLVLAICLFAVSLSPGSVQAQAKLQILDTSTRVEFPTKLSFDLSARSDVSITDIRLYYTIEQQRFAEVVSEVSIDFAPSPAVNVSWTLEMLRISGLPTGALVEYWWRVQDAGGNSAETTAQEVEFADNRHQWQSLSEGQATIYWYEGSDSFARDLMASAQQAMTTLAADTGARPERPASIYVYASSEDLAGALIFPQDWTGGVAFTRFDIIAIGIAPANLSWGKRAIAHELSHLVVHQITLNPYNDLPTWLDEGLAMYAEGLPDPGYTSLLHRAVSEGALISVRSLASPFSAYADLATLSYAQSYSVVEYLIRQYGQARMLELLNTFRQGATYDGALQKVYGFDMDGLNGVWRGYVTQQYQTLPRSNSIPPVLIVILSMLGTGALIGLGLAVWKIRRRSQ